MGDDKAGSALHQVIHCLLNLLLCPGIHGGGRLVQNHDLIVRQNGTGNGEQLLLSLGNIAGVLVQLHLITAGELANEAVRMGSLCRCNDLFVCGVQSAVTDVLHNRPLKQPRVLKHHAKGFPQLTAVKVPDVVAVQQNCTAVHIVKPHEQFYHGSLAGTGWANNGDLLSRLYLCAEIVDDALLRLVAKGNVFEIHTASYLFQLHRMLCRLHFLFLFKELKDTLRGSCHGLHLIDDLCDLLHGLGEVSDVLNERLNLTDGDRATNCQQAAGQRHSHIAQIAHEHHDRLHQTGEKLRLPCGVIQGVIGLLELGNGILLLVVRLDDGVSGVGFLHLSVDVSQIFLLLFEVLL